MSKNKKKENKKKKNKKKTKENEKTKKETRTNQEKKTNKKKKKEEEKERKKEKKERRKNKKRLADVEVECARMDDVLEKKDAIGEMEAQDKQAPCLGVYGRKQGSFLGAGHCFATTKGGVRVSFRSSLCSGTVTFVIDYD